MISILFITYNRSELLMQSFTSLQQGVMKLGVPVEFVVSDDASSPEHRIVINSLGFDVLVFSDTNQGLGANQNQGLANCKGEIIFHIQDDWIFVGQAYDVSDAIDILHSDPEIGIVQLTDVASDLPAERRKTPNGVVYDVFKNDRLPWIRDCGLRPYSDRPHVKRRSFVKDIGPYREHVPMGVMENEFNRRIAIQKRWRVAHMVSRTIFIDHEVEHSLNPGVKRNKIIAMLLSIPFVGKLMASKIKQIWRKFDHFLAILAAY